MVHDFILGVLKMRIQKPFFDGLEPSSFQRLRPRDQLTQELRRIPLLPNTPGRGQPDASVVKSTGRSRRQGFDPSTHMAADDYLKLQFQRI